MHFVAKGHTNVEIAAALGISVDGVKWHVRELLMRFDAESREELVERWAAETSVRARFASIGTGFLGLLQPKFAAIAGGTLVAVGGGVTALAMAIASSPGLGAGDSYSAEPTVVQYGPSAHALATLQGLSFLAQIKSIPPSEIYTIGGLNGDESRGILEAAMESPTSLCLAAIDGATSISVATCGNSQSFLANAGPVGTARLVTSPNGPSVVTREIRAVLVFPSNVQRSEILLDNGGILSVVPSLGPSAFGTDVKFAYAGFAPVDMPFTVVSYDSGDTEIGRWVELPPDIEPRGPRHTWGP